VTDFGLPLTPPFLSVKSWDAGSWTAELRAEREALSLIHFLSNQG
jgi:hypothetical protein